MFLSNSRYAGIATITVRTRDGREVTAVKLRRLSSPSATSYTVLAADRLDIVARRRYEDGTRYWHIADANTELKAVELEVSGRAIEVPES
jgi:nucleoid-associated protein YgaU